MAEGKEVDQKKLEDRYYGRFRCTICNRNWESAHVFAVARTKDAKYKQRCKKCKSSDAWYFPYAMELIKCSQCQRQPCECRCKTCNLLCRPRFWIDPELKEKVVDPKFKSCRCNPGEKVWALGENIDSKKPHLSSLCGRCIQGVPCVDHDGYFDDSDDSDSDDDDDDDDDFYF